MYKNTSLKIIIAISIFGIIFSGYLTYYEMFGGGCGNAIVSCGPKPFTIASLPACAYGLLMYSLVFAVALIGYFSRDEKR